MGDLQKKTSRWITRRKWTVLILVLPLSFLFAIVGTRTSYSSGYRNKFHTWLRTNSRLTSSITVLQREKQYDAVMQPLQAIPPSALAPIGTFHPSCPSVINLKLRYSDFSSFTTRTATTFGATLPGQSTSDIAIYLAIRIEKPDEYITTFIHELTALILYIGSHRFFVHVVLAESAHPSLGEAMWSTLNELRVAYKITLGPKSTSQSYIMENVNRKNLLMEPFYSGDAIHQLDVPAFSNVVFIEDSIFCAEDVLELLYEHKFQGAQLTCALEWRGGLIHDKWTIRTLTGKPPYMQSALNTFFKPSPGSGTGTNDVKLPTPFFTDPTTRKRYRLLRSSPVFSCWSNIVIIDPRVFLPVSKDGNTPSGGEDGEANKPEEQKPGLRFRTISSDPDKYSETFLFCVDMWSRDMYKIIIVPRASIGDTFGMYDLVRQDGRRTLKHPVGLEPEGRMLISYFRWNTQPPGEIVYHDYGLWDENERYGKWNESLIEA